MAKMRRAPSCQICKEKEAEWAMQFVGEDKPTFYVLGWHIRGFRVTKVCDECKERDEAKHGQNDEGGLAD